MIRYHIVISEEAQADLRNLSETISLEYGAPATALQYLKGLYDTMRKLSGYAESLPLQTHPAFRKYGQYVYRINYKRMAIIYTVHNESVYIHRVIAAAAICEL